MAQLAILALAAGGAGGATALGLSASVGWIVGTIVGTLLFPPSVPNQTGPRLGDLTVTSSAYGSPIPMGFGTMRRAGNLIWSTGLEEQEKREKIGGKGGGGGTSTTFEYFATFAISFGVGPAKDVLRIWMDSKLIYDRTGLGDDVSKDGLQFRFYSGDETQLPDSLIEADVGVNNTPAYRGQTYIVFQRLPLADFGNRIPNITAEIAHSITDILPVTEAVMLSAPLNEFDVNAFAIDWKRGLMYGLDTTGGVDTTGIRRINYHSMKEDRQLLSSDALDQDVQGPSQVGGHMVATPGGSLVMQILAPSATNSRPLVALDSNSLRETARFGVSSSSLLMMTTSFATLNDIAVISLAGPLGIEDYVLCMSQFTSFGVLSVTSGMNFLWSSDVFRGSLGSSHMESVCGGFQGKNEGTGYAFSGASYSAGSSAESLKIWKVKLNSGATYSLIGGANTVTSVDVDVIATLTPDDLIPGETLLKAAGIGSVYDVVDDTVIFSAKAASDNQNYIIKVDPATGLVVWRTKISVGPNTGRTWSQSRLNGSTFGYLRIDKAYAVDTRTGDVLLDGVTFAVQGATGNAGAFDSGAGMWLGFSNTANKTAKWLFNRKDGAPALISDVMTTITGKVGLLPADIDVTDLTAVSIPGYTVSQQSSAKNAMQPLLSAFFFDGIESDFILKFVARGGASVRTIVQDDLGVVDKEKALFIKEHRTQEPELPMRFSVSYMDRDNDYQQGTQSAKRIQNPTASMHSTNEIGLAIPGVLISDVAKQIAEKKMVGAWLERVSLELLLDWSNLDLDPSDVIDIVLDNGTTFKARLVQSDLGVDLSLEVTSIQEEVGQYSSTVASDKGTGPTPQTVPSSFATRLLLLDSPLMRDSDEAPSRAFDQMYFLMGGYGQQSWTSGSLFKSPEGSSFSQVGRSVDEMTWGTVIGTLGDPPDSNPFATDETNSIVVAMITDDDVFSTVTQLQMLDGGNPAAILKLNGEIEIIQFRTVVDNGNGTFSLSGLLRGRRGTDTMASSHTPGETFVLLNNTDVQVFPLDLAELNVSRFYRGVGTGQLQENSDLIANTSVGRALMPYAPVLFKATANGSDIDFTWKRRTRVGGSMRDFAGDVGLAEDSEAYELEIFDGPVGTLLRTVTGLTSPLYKYLSADIVSDFGTAPIVLTVKVYQISVQVGRGFSKEVTVDVA